MFLISDSKKCIARRWWQHAYTGATELKLSSVWLGEPYSKFCVASNPLSQRQLPRVK